MARELFAAGFVSCWAELDPASQEQLVRSLEAALASPTIPPGEHCCLVHIDAHIVDLFTLTLLAFLLCVWYW
jgi:hypothetical protein